MSTSFVETVRAQPWYPQVSNAMAQEGVPEYLWIGTIRSEYAAAVYDPSKMNVPVPDSPGFSYGIFQFHNDPNAIDPVYSGNKAAGIMHNALASLPNNYTPRQALSAIEKAAWPGDDSSLIAKEDVGRAAAIQATITEENRLPNALTADPNLQDNPIQQWVYKNTPIGQSEQNLNSGIQNVQASVSQGVNSLQQTITQAGKNAFVGGLILAVIAGGFALLASSQATGEAT